MFQVTLLVISLIASAYSDSCTITSFNEVPTVISTCTNITVGNLSVPAGKTLKLNLRNGSRLTFTGLVSFGGFPNWNGPLMDLTGDKVVVTGTTGHLLHGHGELYWDGKGGAGKPIFIALQGRGSVYTNLHFKNCPVRCVALDSSYDVELNGWIIDNAEGAVGTAPKGKEGHNTDGFDIDKSHGVTIKNAWVVNQDDCVAINAGTNMIFDNMYCKGSHGLSIANGLKTEYSGNIISNIVFRNSVLEGGSNGIRLKTCNDGGPGKIDSVTYENIVIEGPVDYGIFIQQDYSWKQGGSTGVPKGNIPISNVTIVNVSGYMNTTNKLSTAVAIVCAEKACSNIVFENVTLSNGGAKNRCNYEPTGFDC